MQKILEEKLKDYLPQEYQSEISIIDKTNRKVYGLVFRGGKLQNCSPVIYVEALYKVYEETKDLDRVLKDIKNVFMDALEHMPNANNFMDREFMDLSIVYKVIIQNDDFNIAGGVIHTGI
ncbi:MAG: DUF5688 family protein [Clostridium sp.]|nr:DUF5688 family protein [Clostridium sp.]